MPPPAVVRDGNALRFVERVNNRSVRDFLYGIADGLERGFEDFILDFSGATRAYTEGMLPIVCRVDALRQERDIGFEVVLPEDQVLMRLFENTNWAHFIQPDDYAPVDFEHERNLAVRRYTTFEEQQQIVNDVLSIVMGNMELERDVLGGLEWSINEITDNVLNHAQAEYGGLVQVSTFRDQGYIKFVVADAGRGVLASMLEGHPRLQGDAQAIEEAVKHGVTRSPDAGQGNGLAGTLRIAVGSEGSFAVTSGRAQVQVMREVGQTEYSEHTYRRRPRSTLPGTTVTVELGTSKHFTLAEALGFAYPDGYEAWDIVDSGYTSESGDYLNVCICDEPGGCGTRLAGLRLRTKLQNLLTADGTKRLVIDWSGVPLISSSYADEAIGKLYADMGPLSFGTRVQNIRMEPLVRSLVERAIVQRVTQQFNQDDQQPEAFA